MSLHSSSLQNEIEKDDSLMQYAIKGSDDQWKQLLKDKEINESGTVQIQSVRQKRKTLEGDDFEKEDNNDRKPKKTKKKKKKGGK